MSIDVNSSIPLGVPLTTDRIVATRAGVGSTFIAGDFIALIVSSLAGQKLYLTLAEAVADATLLNGKAFIVIDAATGLASIYKRDTAVSTALQPKLTDIPNISMVTAMIADSLEIYYGATLSGGSSIAYRITGITQPQLVANKILHFTPPVSNTGAATLFVASIGEARPFRLPNNTDFSANTLLGGQPCLFNYNSTTGIFHLMAPLPTTASSGGGGGSIALEFVKLNIAAQTLNAFTLSDANLPTNVDDIVMAWQLNTDPATEGGWSVRVVGHPQLNEARQIRWPGGDPVLDQITDSGALADQLILATYRDADGYATLQYPFRGSAGSVSTSRDDFYAQQNARIAALMSAENEDAIDDLGESYQALALRTAPDDYAGDALTLDFANGHYNFHGERVWGIKSAPGITYARTGVKGELDNGQFRLMEATNPAIIKGQGYWSRKAVTNLLLNSSLLVTQNVTVTAVQHTLSFFGTGTVTLTGASTAGPLVGTGRRNRVEMSFTPTAGALTLTVSGDVQMASLVIGDSEGPIIQTLGATVAVAADALTLSAALDDEPWFAFVVANMQQAGVLGRLMVFDDGTNPNRITFGRTALNDMTVQVLLNSVAQTVAIPSASTINGTGKIAVGLRRDAAGKFSCAFRYADGSIGIATPGVAAPMIRGIRRLSVGHYSAGEQPQSPISLIRVIRRDLSNAEISSIYGAL